MPNSSNISTFLKLKSWGAWVAQSVKRLTSAQVTILRYVSSSPVSGSVLTAQSLEPVSDSVSPSLSAPPLLVLCLSVCLSLSAPAHTCLPSLSFSLNK